MQGLITKSMHYICQSVLFTENDSINLYSCSMLSNYTGHLTIHLLSCWLLFQTLCTPLSNIHVISTVGAYNTRELWWKCCNYLMGHSWWTRVQQSTIWHIREKIWIYRRGENDKLHLLWIQFWLYSSCSYWWPWGNNHFWEVILSRMA